MRFLKLGVYAPVYLDRFYADRPNIERRPYSEQHSLLIGDLFGSSDFWTAGLRQRGFETCDTIVNAKPLQKQWAIENGLEWNEPEWMERVAIAQVASFRPDVVLIADYSTLGAAFVRRMRDSVPSVRLVMGWCGAPYSDDSVFDEWDVVLSCVPELVSGFIAKGHRAFHLNHAFEPRILDSLDHSRERAVDFSFLGSIVGRVGFHLERERLLADLLKSTGLQIWADVPRRFDVRTLLSRGRKRLDPSILRRAKPSLFGKAMFQQLRDSKTTFNNHIDISVSSASNMRLFEATGVGTCLVTDWKDNLPELFEPDTEVVTYKSALECADKVSYLLKNETERETIAAAGQRRTLKNHNFQERSERISDIVENAMKAVSVR